MNVCIFVFNAPSRRNNSFQSHLTDWRCLGSKLQSECFIYYIMMILIDKLISGYASLFAEYCRDEIKNMTWKIKAASYFAIFSWILLCIGWFIPFWFGRVYKYSSKRQWGLFYIIQCEIGNCTTIAGPIKTESVDFLGSTTTGRYFYMYK